MKTKHSTVKIAAATSSAILGVSMATSVTAAEVGAEDGWKVGFSGLVNAFVASADWDVGNNQEKTTRVMSGFNPSKFNALIKAPQFEGVDITGHFQLAPSIQSNKAKFAGNSIEVRVAQITVNGSFGTVEIGRGWSIFNAQAIINDTASGLGVGRIATPDRGGPTFGRIGVGYTWTDFDPRVAYTTPDLGGFQLRVGIFDPIEQPFGAGSLPANSGGTGVGALETKTPRVEAEATYAVKLGGAGLKVWAGILDQSVQDKGTNSDTSIEGLDGGVRLDFAGLGLTGAYSTTEGVGSSGFQGNGFLCDAAGCRSAKTEFWYGGVDYRFSKTTIGVSAGEGNQKARNGFAKVENTLDMAFIQHQLFPQLFVMLEYHRFETKTNGVTSEKYDAIIVGSQYNF